VSDELYPLDAESEVEQRFALYDRVMSVFGLDGSEIQCDADDEAMLRAAMNEFFSSNVDRAIDLTTVYGSEVTVRASRIDSWLITTSQSRLRARTVRREIKRGNKANGIIDGEP